MISNIFHYGDKHTETDAETKQLEMNDSVFPFVCQT